MDSDRATELAEKALAFIRKYRLAATPRNFRFWFTYAEGKHTEFCTATKLIRTHQSSFDQATLDNLYDRYLSKQFVLTNYSEFNTTLNDKISHVVDSLKSDLGRGQILSLSSSVKSVQELKQRVDQITRALREAKAENDELAKELKDKHTQIISLQENFEQARKSAMTDPLTLLPNRKYFDHALTRHIRACLSLDRPLSLIIADIDHFKKLNDQHGHLVGDQLLRTFAVILRKTFKSDVTARIGGEEFAIILPRCPLLAASRLAKRLNENLREAFVRMNQGSFAVPLTVSQGISTLRRGDDTLSMFERADKCLYQAKAHGRNRIAIESSSQTKFAHNKVPA